MWGPTSSGSPGYRHSGRCDWFKLLTVALPVGLLLAMVLALLMFETVVWVRYVIIFTPGCFALVLGGLASPLFRYAHCRNNYVAGAFACVFASAMYLGYYQARMVASGGLPMAARIDLLPMFIRECIQQDTIVEERPGLPDKVNPANPTLNWLLFAADWLIAARCCSWLLVLLNRRCYCEQCGRWMIRKTAHVAPGMGEMIVAAIAAEQIDSLPDSIPNVSLVREVTRVHIDVEYCPGSEAVSAACPAYFSVRSSSGLIPNYLVKQVPLSPEEMAGLAKRLEFR